MSTCASCGAPIMWVVTPSKNMMPLDAAPTIEGNVIVRDGTAVVLKRDTEPPVGAKRYTSHFATCVNAKAHRKAKP